MSYRMILKGKYALFAPLLVLLLVAIACGDDATAVPTTAPAATAVPDATAPDAPTTAPATVAPTAAPQPTATPAAMEPKLAAKLTLALNSFGNERMHPLAGAKIAGMASFTHFLDYMIGIEEDNTLTNAWGWADSWEMIEGDTWDIDIRKGLIDHDGVEITAEDGVWITAHWAEEISLSGTNAIAAGWKNIYESTEALDSHKIRIHLNQPYAFTFAIIPPIGGADMYVFPKHGWFEADETEDGWEALGAPGTGFVDFIDREIGVSVRMERYDDYYADEEFHFKYKELEVLMAPEDAPRLAMVQTGAADIANMSGPFADEITAAGLRIDGPNKVDVVYLSMYQTYDEDHCTNDVRVRKAMNLAVDAQAIVDGLWPPGAASRATTAFTSPYNESWDPSLQPYGYDPDEARLLLEAAGCDGFDFTAYGYAFAAGPEMRDMADAIVTYLSGVGINATFVPIDWAAMTPSVIEEKLGAVDGPASGGSHWQLGARNFADMIRVHGLCRSSGGSVCNLDEQEKWKTNYLAYAAVMDREERLVIARELHQELYEGYYGIPIALRNAIWALNPDTICGEWHPIDGTPSHVMLNTLTPCETS